MTAHLDDALAIGFIFTALSIVRSYLLRRLWTAPPRLLRGGVSDPV